MPLATLWGVDLPVDLPEKNFPMMLCILGGGGGSRSATCSAKFEHTLRFKLCFTEVFSTKDQSVILGAQKKLEVIVKVAIVYNLFPSPQKSSLCNTPVIYYTNWPIDRLPCLAFGQVCVMTVTAGITPNTP